jgi:cell division protein FtsB
MNKKMVLRKLLVLEIVIFMGYYLFGFQGLHSIQCLKTENSNLEEKIFQERTQIDQLNVQIVQWDATLFFKEKIAREQLQMAKEGDEIYYLT